METVHTVLTWLAVWVASSVVLSPLLAKWIRNRSKYSFRGFPDTIAIRQAFQANDSTRARLRK